MAAAGGLTGEDGLDGPSGFEALDDASAEEIAVLADGEDEGWPDGVPADEGQDSGWEGDEEGDVPPLPPLALDDDPEDDEEASKDDDAELGDYATLDVGVEDEVTDDQPGQELVESAEAISEGEELDPLPLLGDDAESEEGEAELAEAVAEVEVGDEYAEAAAESTEDEGDATEEPDADADVSAAVEEAWEEAVSVPDDPVQVLRDRVEEDPADHEGWRLLGEGLIGRGESSDGVAALERAHTGFADEERLDQAMRVVRELVLHEPDKVPHHQRLVEYAHRMGDRTLLIPAYQELAECLVRTGESSKAQAVYQQVIAVDPGNRRASDGLRRLEAGSDEASAGAVSSDYVDLGSMVLDEGKERSTRWTVAADAPSGDEEADFAKMLSQFKAKVAENLSSDDDKAHYDLGTAYKEMGLQDEAIGEFQQAIRANPNSLASYEMLGQCFLDKSQAEIAVRSLEKALELPYAVEDELLGIYYYLGRAHEESGNSDSAQEFYEKVFALDINFHDVTERLRALR